jgi:hypothetical protein
LVSRVEGNAFLPKTFAKTKPKVDNRSNNVDVSMPFQGALLPGDCSEPRVTTTRAYRCVSTEHIVLSRKMRPRAPVNGWLPGTRNRWYRREHRGDGDAGDESLASTFHAFHERGLRGGALGDGAVAGKKIFGKVSEVCAVGARDAGERYPSKSGPGR